MSAQSTSPVAPVAPAVWHLRKQTMEVMKVAGTEAWAEVHEIIHAPSGDTSGVDAEFAAFAINKERAAYLCAAANAYPNLLLLLQQAVARIELENEEEGNPILSAWLPEARAALALAKPL